MAATPTGRTLSRDYKHVRRQSPGATVFNGWVGLATGLAIGLTVALGTYLHYQNLAPAEPQPAAATPPASAQAPEEEPAPAEPANDYKFYEMLPRQEVEVPQRDARARAARTVRPEGELTLQVGAFKQLPEAERLQARLAQYGIDAKIQRFSLDDETWYRVRIGPIATVEERDALREKLAEAEVEAAQVTAEAEVPLP
jgi:cell division protein FtsN